MYALIKNGAVVKYPYSFAMLRKDNPNVSYPHGYDIMKEDDVVSCQSTFKPDYDLTKNITEGTPQTYAGVWLQMWEEVPASAEEIAARQVREKSKAEHDEVKQDTFVNNFIGMSPAQVNAYIDSNVTDLASAKNVLNKLALMVLLLARQEFGE